MILEKLALEELFLLLEKFLQNLVDESEKNENLKNYVILELNILKILGYEIDLSSCVATGVKENLKYVSPKSARAVCFEAGKPYENKMLKLPAFFLDNSSKGTKEDIKDGLELTQYFLLKFIFDGDMAKISFRSQIKI